MSVAYGVVTIAGSDIAINAETLQEVVSWPTEMAPHPAAAESVLGVFSLRGRPVPLFDLRRALGRPASETTGRVAILRHGKGRLGIAIDAVADVIRLEESRFCGVAASDADASVFPHMAALGSRLVYRLDLGALATLPGVFFTREEPGAVREIERHARFTQRHYLVFACDGRDFAIDAAAVTELVDKPVIEPADFPGEMCPSIASVRGVRVPVVNLTLFLGLQPVALTEAKPQLLVLSTATGDRFGFAYDRLVSMQRLPTQRLGRMPAFGLREPDLYAGTFPFAEGRHALLLDHANVAARRTLVNLAKLYQQRSGAEQEMVEQRQRVRLQACLVFRAPHPFVAPLAQIQEILPVPSGLIELTQPDGPLLGLFELRGEQVPLLSLNRLVTEAPGTVDRDAQKILVIRMEAGTFGLAVDAIDAIDSFSQFDGARPDDSWHGGAVPVHARVRSLVSVGTCGRSRMLPLVDLAGIVRELGARA